MCKLLVSSATLGTGGAERVLSILSTHLADNYDEVQYILWEGGDAFYPVDSRIKIISLPELSGRKGRLNQIGTFRRLIMSQKPDLLLSFLTPYNILALISVLGLNIRVVVSERTDPQRLLAGGKPMLWLRDILYKKADGIIVQTEYARSCYKKRFAGKTQVIYNPIMMNEDQVGMGLKTVKRHIVVSVGRLEEVKDHFTMIEAFSKFYKSHNDYQLVIYGEGPMRNQLEDLVISLGLSGHVVLAGRNDNVWDAMADAEFFLLSSEYEGMSNAMIEAMCLGLPVISTKVAGATDLIKDGGNGYLIDIKDADAMAGRMGQLAEDSDLRNRMGEDAKNVYEMLRADKICEQWINYLDRRMGKKTYGNR